MKNLIKISRILVINLILVSLLVAGFSLPVYAATDTVTSGTISLTPTLECIGVVSNFTDDDNQNNNAILEYRQAGTSTWKTAPQMYADRERGQYRGSIFWLTANTNYEVRVTYTDPDGVSGSPVTASIKTLNDNPPSNGNTYYVATTGNDSNLGTEASPLRTIQKAADTVSAGDTVLIKAGTYYEQVYIKVSGTAENYITFKNYGTDKVVIDAQNIRDFNICIGGEDTWAYGFDFIRIKGLELTNARHTSIIIKQTSDHIIIEDNIMLEPGSSSEIGNQVEMGAGVAVWHDSSNIIIQRNQISRSVGPATWDSKEAVYGVMFWYTGGGHVVRDNIIIGPTIKDGIGGGSNFSADGFVDKDSDIYDNIILDCWDDAIEVEGGMLNVRVWGNYIEDCFIGIAFCPVLEGPAYIFRNVITTNNDDATDGTAAYKMGHDSYGRVYVYHNTYYTNYSDDGFKETNQGLGNVVSRNNIIHAGRYIFEMGGPNHDFDYDSLYTVDVEDLGRFIKWNGDKYYNLDSFQTATAQEIHGISGDPLFVDPANGNLVLQGESPCIDAGMILPGFNDANSPWPYSGASPDIGAYEYGSGGPINSPPVLNTIGNRSINIGQTLQFTVSAIDPNGDTLTYSASNLPAGATFTPSSRTFSWTPTSGQAGSYPNVRFTVSDGSLTDSENITITVLSGDENQPPVLNYIGGKATIAEELLEFTVTATDPNDDDLTLSADNLPDGASFDPESGVFSWTPTSGQAGTYSNVHFEVSDGELTDEEDITITVSALPGPTSLPLRVNAAGNVYIDSQSNTWRADQAYVSGSWGFYGTDNTVDRGTGHAISGTVDDRIYQTERYSLSGYQFDIENGTYDVVLHFAETYHTNPGQRVFDVSIEGQLVLDNLDIYSEAGYSAALEKVFTGIVIQDGQLNIDFTSSIEEPEINGIEILLAGGNQAPVLSPIGNKSITEEELLEFIISATDPDADPLTFSASNLPTGATFNTTTRTFSWTPTSSQVGSYSDIRFVVSDGEMTDFENITIAVLNEDNSAPVLNEIGNKTVREGELLEFTISATDPDVDLLTFSASNLPTGATFNTTTRTFSWTPALGQRGNYYFIRFSVTDGALDDYEYITITVTINDPPVLDAINDRSVREGELLEFTISATDSDDDPLTFNADNLPDGASFNPETGVFSWTPTSNQIGTHPDIFFRVSDGTFADSENITITVLSLGNNAPVLDTIGDKTVNEAEFLEFTISATDPEDDPLTFNADNLPDGASFDPETGVFSWTPAFGQEGEYSDIHFEVSDGDLTDSEDITITVTIPDPPDGGGGDVGGNEPGGGGGSTVGGGSTPSSNGPPVLSEIGDRSVEEGGLLEFTVSATDPDDDPLTFSADNLPYGSSFDPETRVFSWTPEAGQADTYPDVYFEVSDGELTDEGNITITVSISTPPIIQEVKTSDVGIDSAVIRWTTTEPSTSQVEYWASPSQFSPLDETLVTEHEVYLTGLKPGTDYHYRTISQDEAGNLVTSPAFDFTTPTKPAAFTVSWLTINPAEADIGQEVAISALITNTGDAAGSYDVILSIDDEVEATESIVDLAGGESQEVAFTITRENAGVFTVNVNGTTGTLVVSDVGEPEAAIELFNITPDYESDTGVITFARVDYGIYESYYSTLFSQLDVELILKVGLDGEPLEEVTLIASGQSEPDMSTGNLNYIPSEGWTSTTYSFQAELRTGEGVIETSPPVRLIITPAVAAGVASWATLGEIIGGVLIIALLAVLLILHRNRDMLRAQSLE